MNRYLHGCYHDREQELIDQDRQRAHEAGECKKGCDYCEDEKYERSKAVCQDCGEKALPGYIAGDRCERLRKRNACVPETVCGGRLDRQDETMGYMTDELLRELHPGWFDGSIKVVRSDGGSMNFADVSKINLERALEWHKGGLDEWGVTDWSNATAGEMGELCNAIKKLRRVEDGISQAKGPHTKEEALADISTEIGDVYLYLDLLAQRLGINIETAIKDTFNRVSVRENFPQKL